MTAALARSSYRALVRAVLGLERQHQRQHQHEHQLQRVAQGAQGAQGAHVAEISFRARSVLLDRVCALVREDGRDDDKDGEARRRRRRPEDAAVRAFTARCAAGAAFFRRAHADPRSAEAAYARMAVGYLDGARRRARRTHVPMREGEGGDVPKTKVKKKARLAEDTRRDIFRAVHDGILTECDVFVVGCTPDVRPHVVGGLIPYH